MTALYTSGTISLVNGSAVINGIGTAWATSLIVGGTVLVEAEGNPLPILPDDSAGASEHPITDTQMTAAIKWQGATGTYKYALVRENTYTSQQAANATAVSELLRRMNNQTIAALAGVRGVQDHLILLTGPSTATIIPRTSLIQGIEADATVEAPANLVTYDGEAAGFIVLVSNAGSQRAALYFKRSTTAGDWAGPAFLTGDKGIQGDVGPRGVIWRGAWNAVTAYAKYDLVRDNKSAWISLRANTNIPPPVLPTIANNDWELFAPAGMDGTGTGDVLGLPNSVAGYLAAFAGTDGKQLKQQILSAFAASILDDASGSAMFSTMGAGQALGQSGWQRLPSGLIIQWGYATSVGTSVPVTFPTAFPNAVYTVSLGVINNDGNPDAMFGNWAADVTKSSFRIFSRYAYQGGAIVSTGAVSAGYVAIGS